MAIAAHALRLATVIEGQDATTRILFDLVTSLEGALELSESARRQLQLTVRQIHSLTVSNRKKAARDLLREVAAVELPVIRPLPVDRSNMRLATEIWPTIFVPTETTS
ncbi:MAG: hypothetical protein EOQ28_04195 [Mesorhizobium sp.]|nr:MAG: hypothetical protein EOQ28_04195 [Mesorhizobium sp.]